MEEIENKLRMERYRLSCSAVYQFDCQLDKPLAMNSRRLIGYPHFADVFLGLVPLADYDDNGNFIYLNDFPEIFPNEIPADIPAFQKTGSAVLFTGDTGCGKHTADYTFMHVTYRFVEEEVIQALRESGDFSIPRPSDLDDITLRFYRIDQSVYHVFSEKQLGEVIRSLFEQMRETAFSDPSVLLFFSLGDVTRILNSARLAPIFADCVRQLTTDPRSRCILTCIYTGRAAQLPTGVKKPFYVLELTPPGVSDRLEYFRYLTESYPNVRFELSASQLADLTDGFNFAQIKQFAGYLLMTVKSELKKKKLKLSEIRFGQLSDQDVIVLTEQSIRTFAEMIRNSQTVHTDIPSEQRPPSPGQAPPEVVTPVSADLPESPPPDEKKGNEDDGNIPILVEKKLKNIDKPSELRKISDELFRPAGYKATMLMENQVFFSSVYNIYVKDIESFFAQCSEKGLTSLSNLKAVSISTGGNLEFRPKDKSRLKPAPPGKKYDYKVIIFDGKISADKLYVLGKDNTWLAEQLKKNGCRSLSEVFLGACDENNEMTVFRIK